jgi:1,4-dihydroxy-2-naphthoyl-CoA hydrolase
MRPSADPSIGGRSIGLGMSNHSTYLRSIREGTIHATACRIHRGRTTWVWDVELTDDDDRTCAVSRVTIAGGRFGVDSSLA